MANFRLVQSSIVTLDLKTESKTTDQSDTNKWKKGIWKSKSHYVNEASLINAIDEIEIEAAKTNSRIASLQIINKGKTHNYGSMDAAQSSTGGGWGWGLGYGWGTSVPDKIVAVLEREILCDSKEEYTKITNIFAREKAYGRNHSIAKAKLDSAKKEALEAKDNTLRMNLEKVINTPIEEKKGLMFKKFITGDGQEHKKIEEAQLAISNAQNKLARMDEVASGSDELIAKLNSELLELERSKATDAEELAKILA